MATAKQLPSGSWRVQVYDGELKKTVSFTSKLPGKAGKAEAELMAREYQLGLKQKRLKGKKVGECIDEYSYDVQPGELLSCAIINLPGFELGYFFFYDLTVSHSVSPSSSS